MLGDGPGGRNMADCMRDLEGPTGTALTGGGTGRSNRNRADWRKDLEGQNRNRAD